MRRIAIVFSVLLGYSAALCDVPVPDGSSDGKAAVDPRQESNLTKLLRNIAAYYGSARSLAQASLKEMRNVQDMLWSVQSVLWNVNATASAVERIANTINSMDDGKTGIEIIKDLELNVFEPTEDIYYDYRVQIDKTVAQEIPGIACRFYADATNPTLAKQFKDAVAGTYDLVTGRQLAAELRNAANLQMDQRDLQQNPSAQMVQVGILESGHVMAGMEMNLTDIEKQAGVLAGQRQALKSNIGNVNMSSASGVQTNLSRDELVLQYQSIGVQAERTEMLAQLLASMSVRNDAVAEQHVLEWESFQRRSKEIDQMTGKAQ